MPLCLPFHHKGVIVIWCASPDLNRDEFPPRLLRPLRLPFRQRRVKVGGQVWSRTTPFFKEPGYSRSAQSLWLYLPEDENKKAPEARGPLTLKL